MDAPPKEADLDESSRRGVENPRVVDLIQLDRETGEVVLVMLESRGWIDWPRQVLEIQAKYNSYLSYLVGGFLERDYPDYRGRHRRIELECVAVPGEEQLAFMEAMRAHAAEDSIGFSVRVRLREED